MELQHRDLLIEILHDEFGRLVVKGEDAKAGVLKDAIDILSMEHDPGFYVDVYFRYAKEGLIPWPAAAVGALYAFVAAHDKPPIEAKFEGCQPTLALNENNMAKVPFWILSEVFKGFSAYISNNAHDLNSAFGIPKGTKGSSKVFSPIEDLNKCEIATYERLKDIQEGGRGAKSNAAARMEEWARSKSLTGVETFGFEERSTRKAISRMRKAFILRNQKKRKMRN